LGGLKFGLESVNPANLILRFTPAPGFINAGSGTDLFMAATGCPPGPIVAGTLLVLSNAPGDYCIVPTATGHMVSAECLTFDEGPVQQIGYSNTGSDPSCMEELCPETGTDEASWGEIKTMFR